MTTTLDVVNECLGTMGEAPLNTLVEPHEFRGAALRKLAEANTRLQARGWWFNRESLTLTPAPVTGHAVLGTDILKWQSGTRSPDILQRSQPKPWLVQRGTRLYDTRTGTYEITETVTGEVTREIPFDTLPAVMQAYVKAEAVLRFQSNFDADNSKRQELTSEWQISRADAVAEDVRQSGVNFINSNPRLQRIKNASRQGLRI